YQQFPRFSGTSELFDLRIEIEQHRVGQLSHLMKTVFGAPGLTLHAHNRSCNSNQHKQHNPHAQFVAANELCRAIGHAIRPGADRLLSQIAAEVITESRNRVVPFGWVLFQGLTNNGVQISAKLTAKLIWSSASLCRCELACR